MSNAKAKTPKGFTLIEVILAITIFALLASFTTINLLQPQTKATLDSTVTTLVADIKEQQTKAMAGDSLGSGTAQNHGIYFENTRYIIFKGPGYVASDPTNFVVNIDPSLSLYFNLPNSQIFFSQNSGEWDDLAEGKTYSDYSITVQSNDGVLASPQPSGTTCADADVDDDGSVTNTDRSLVNNNQSPPYKYKYDVNHDGFVDSDDRSIVNSLRNCTILTPPSTTEKKTITVNRYGAITIN